MGMMASLFTAVLAINVFKDANEEGTELIVISKPISRIKNIITKFALFGFFCLIVNFTTVILTSFTIFLPRTEPQFYVGLLVSMFIGNLITFAVFGSISILLTVKFAKVGVIVTNVIISLVFLIYQMLTLFVFSTPSMILDKNFMSASSYIFHQRNTETGTYDEDWVVKFQPSDVSDDSKHPCEATNWKEMKQFWEKDILGNDVSPILNVTDLASQLALTYLSYKTNAYAQREAERTFAISRFYNYELTSPASPEINDSSVPQRRKFNWIYTDFYEIEISESPRFSLYLPKSFGFEGIQPLDVTRLKGYTDQIPIGTVKSKEILSSRDVYFEKEDWVKYKTLFDRMYDDVFNWENYSNVTSLPDDEADKTIMFSKDVNAIKKYYEVVWAILCGSQQDKQDILSERIYQNWKDCDSKQSFAIKNVDDLNDRFIQFKNYCYWKALNEQQKALNDLSSATQQEQSIYPDVQAILGLILPYLKCRWVNNSWMIESDGTDEGYLAPDTLAPSFDLVQTVHNQLKTNDVNYPTYAQNLVYSKIKKTMSIFNNVCNPNETYLYVDISSPIRTTKYSGKTFMQKDNWYPYLNGLLKDFIDVSLPLGQNLQYFFYKTKPTLDYWLFAVIWGTLSIGLFAGGVVIYNKYDIK